jgi:hypothetical protein
MTPPVVVIMPAVAWVIFAVPIVDCVIFATESVAVPCWIFAFTTAAFKIVALPVTESDVVVVDNDTTSLNVCVIPLTFTARISSGVGLEIPVKLDTFPAAITVPKIPVPTDANIVVTEMFVALSVDVAKFNIVALVAVMFVDVNVGIVASVTFAVEAETDCAYI